MKLDWIKIVVDLNSRAIVAKYVTQTTWNTNK